MTIRTKKEIWRLCPIKNLLIQQEICAECERSYSCNGEFVKRRVKVSDPRSKKKSSKKQKYVKCKKNNMLVTNEVCKNCIEYKITCQSPGDIYIVMMSIEKRLDSETKN